MLLNIYKSLRLKRRVVAGDWGWGEWAMEKEGTVNRNNNNDFYAQFRD